MSPSTHHRRQKPRFPDRTAFHLCQLFPDRTRPFRLNQRHSAAKHENKSRFAEAQPCRSSLVRTWCRATLIESAAPKLVRSGTRFESRFAAKLLTLDLTVGSRFDLTETIGASRSTTRRNHPLQIVLFYFVVPVVPKPAAGQPPS